MWRFSQYFIIYKKNHRIHTVIEYLWELAIVFHQVSLTVSPRLSFEFSELVVYKHSCLVRDSASLVSELLRILGCVQRKESVLTRFL